MRDVSCKLLSTTYENGKNGEKIPVKKTEKEIPIINEESVYANEFYQGNEQGYKPSLRLIISNLNYNNEEDLIYMNTEYSIIRTQKKNEDELILVCERKIKNVKNYKA